MLTTEREWRQNVMAESKEALREPVASVAGVTGSSVKPAGGEKARLPLNRVVACDPVELEPRDPMAHPVYKRRVEGAARPIYQLGEEPMRLQENAGEAGVVSPKMELDIMTFLRAVHAAFPHPKDPLVRPVLKARPAKAARPFLFVAGSKDDPRKEEQARVPEAETWVDAPYDPVLNPALDASGELRPVSGNGQTRSEVVAGMESSHGGDWLTAEVKQVQRELVEAVVEPREPVARPRMPGGRHALPPRLSPSQRARAAAGER